MWRLLYKGLFAPHLVIVKLNFNELILKKFLFSIFFRRHFEFFINMPPKKNNNTTLAYVAKCNKCGKKHAPPLHEGCLQLFTNGYIAIVQNECNTQIARLMMSHLRTLMEDAVYHGWEAVKRAHMTILTCLESGEFTWFHELQMAEKRRSALNRAATIKDNFTNSGYSKYVGQGQGRGQGKSFSNRAGGVIGKKLVKPCVYFNNNSCSKRGDHEENNVFYKHVCSHCFGADHCVKECNFLTNTM
jgi:hypothetical protein